MAYSATLALSVITNRLWTPSLFIGLYPLRDSIFHGDGDSYLHFVAGLGGWLGWTIPLAAVCLWFKRSSTRSSAVPGWPAAKRCNLRS